MASVANDLVYPLLQKVLEKESCSSAALTIKRTEMGEDNENVGESPEPINNEGSYLD
jgi:hypothetical protein